MNRGSLIVFEGIDGVGKSTQVELLTEVLRGRGHAALSTREPTEGVYGRRIRAEARAGRRAAPEEELAWFVADRREHVEQVVAPALAAGRTVVCDRYFLSTVAYQGARGLDPAALLRDAETEFPLPDLALLLCVEPGVGLERVRGRDRQREEVFEQAAVLEAVAAVFAAIEREYLVRVDGLGGVEEVHARVLACVDRALPGLSPLQSNPPR